MLEAQEHVVDGLAAQAVGAAQGEPVLLGLCTPLPSGAGGIDRAFLGHPGPAGIAIGAGG